MQTHDFTPTTIATLGGLPLPEHDEDPEGVDHQLVPGHWETAPCAVADESQPEGAMVWSSLTDPDGVYGPPRIFTAWGNREATRPYVAHIRWPESDRPCEHAIYVPDTAAEDRLAA